MFIPDAVAPAFDVPGIWHDAGLFARAVMAAMLVMSLYATWVALDRHLRYRETRRQAARLLPELGRLLAAGRRDAALELVRRHPRCHQARIVHALLAESDWTNHEGDPDGAIGEALVTTAGGLLIAIPAVWLYNGFNLKVESFSVEMRRTGVRLLDYVARQTRA